MKITKITKRLGRTISNKVTFSSITVHNEVEALVESGEPVEEAEQKLYDKVADLLAKDLDRIRKAKEDAKKNQE